MAITADQIVPSIPRRCWRLASIALVLSTAPAGDALAQSLARGENVFTSVYFENDLFYDRDQSYTNGVKIVRGKSLDQAKGHALIPVGLLRRVFKPSCEENDRLCWEWTGGWTFGQNMYTPQNIRNPNVITDDRPYGGWLYAGRTLVVSRPELGDSSELRAFQHTFEFDIGVTGQASFAEETQKWVHENISGSAEPMGWGNQVGGTLGVLLHYTGKTRLVDARDALGGLGFDVTPNWTASLGNMFTQAGAGVGVRAGWKLGDDFGTDRIVPVAAMMARRSDFEAYGFANFAGRAVAHNIFLDGRLFQSDIQTVSKKALVGDFEVGGFLRVNRIGLAYRWIRRSPEFSERTIYQKYGAINFVLLL